MRVVLPLLRIAILVALVLGLLGRDVAAEASSPPFLVIVNSQNPHSSLERTFVSDAFLKKTTRWPNGEVIKPVDQAPESGTRERFSQDVLKRSVGAVKSYWQQVIFSGRDVPPPELPNDDAVVRYVSTHPSAIGYVSASTRLTDAKLIVIH